MSNIKNRFATIAVILNLLFAVCHAQTNKFTHTVKQGETVYAISRMYGVSPSDIMNANPGIGDALRAGSVLKIPLTGNSFVYHTLQPKETLYSLAKKYGVDEKTIVDANPGLSETNFNAGTTIKIPCNRFAALAVDTVADHPTGIAGTDCREMHITKKGETLYSIAKQYGVTLEALCKANPDIAASPEKKLRKATYVCIPFANESSSPAANVLPPAVASASAPAPASASQNKNSRIAFFMPFFTDAGRSLQFYRGFLYVLNELRKTGKSFVVESHNAGQSVAEIKKILASNKNLQNADVVVSCGTENVCNAIAEWCSQHKVRMFLPYAKTLDAVYNTPYVTLAQMPDDYFNGVYARYFLNTAGTDAGILCFETSECDGATGQLLKELQSLGRKVEKFSLSAKAEDIAGALKAHSRNIVILTSPLQADYMKLSALLDKSCAGGTQPVYTVVGHPSWKDFGNAARSTFYRHNVTVCTPQFINVYSSGYAPLRQYFIDTFHKTPSAEEQRSFFLGIDCANKLFSVDVPSLSHPFSLQRTCNWGGEINGAARIVRFTPNNTVEINDYE